MPKVSVIVPNYNHTPYLLQRIESILNQTYQDFELILLDDCSTDNSVEILKQYENHPKVSHLIINEQNSGNTFKQWDKGVQLAVGEWIWIAESDDWAESFMLEKLVDGFNSSNNIVISFCQSKRINAEGEETGDWKDWTDEFNTTLFNQDFTAPGKEYISRYLVKKNTIPNASAVVFRKQAYFQVKGVDKDIRYVSDWLLWLKLLLVGDIAFTAYPYNNFRYHDNSVIAKAVSSDKDMFQYKYDIILRKRYLKYIRKNKADKNITELFRKRLAFECKSEAKLNKSFNNKKGGFNYMIDLLKYDNNKLKVVYLIVFRFLFSK